MSTTGSPSVPPGEAPRPRAAGTKRRASCLKPGTATKTSPRATRRESAVSPVTDTGGVPITRLSASASSSTLTGTSRGMSTRVTGTRAARQQPEAGYCIVVHALAGRRRLLRDAAAAVELHAQAERRQQLQSVPQRASTHVGHETGGGGGGRRHEAAARARPLRGPAGHDLG